MRNLPRPAATQSALAAIGAALVVGSIHGVLPLAGLAAQILAVVGPLAATASFAAIVALRERAGEQAVDTTVVDELTGLASRDGLLVELARLYRETTLDTPTQLILLDLV